MDIAAIDGTLIWILGFLLIVDLVALLVRRNQEESYRAELGLTAIAIVIIGLAAYLA